MPITAEVVRDAPRNTSPIDESVIIPASVKKAQALAEQLHAAAYAPETPAQPDPGAVAPALPPDPGAVVPPVLVAEPPVVPVVPAVEPPEEGDGSWKHRFLSMQGRWQASQRTIGDLQEQMSQLGDELVRTQQMVARPARPEPARPAATPATNLLTPEDTTTYGPELIDFATRAAQQAVAPALTRLEKENQDLRKQVTTGAQRDAYTALTAQVPNWREVNRLPAFNGWLKQRDVYSGRIRIALLNEANAAADAPRMAAFFKSFLAEQEATGTTTPTTQPAAGITPPARQAAVGLAALVAPGRPRPASGDTPVTPAEKPVITRAQITQFYANVRAGRYVGRDAEKAADEAMIFSAQADGRVR